MINIQNWIHKIEVGSGLRYLRLALLLLAVLALTVAYDWRAAKNLANPEAMDTAQLARSLAGHKGFTTLCVRPFSLYLMQRAYTAKHGPAKLGDTADAVQLRDRHPDLANAPLYPLVLAAYMKAAPAVRYQPADQKTVWNRGAFAGLYPPDFQLTLFNQGLFLLAVVAVFFLARRLFDATVAWTSAGLFLGTELFWRFTTSGLSTNLLILIFLALVGSLLIFEQNEREAKWGPGAFLVLAGVIGGLVGLGALTRYSFAWFLLPVLAFLALFGGKRRMQGCVIALGVFLVLLTPWLIRNYQVSHTLFGTAGYSVYETTAYFPGHRLERSLQPDLVQVRFIVFWWKLANNAHTLLLEDLPSLGGTWLSAFFLVGLLVSFRNQALNRLRWFLVFCLPVLFVVQALGRTERSKDFPAVNSENLFVLLAPLVIMFGVSLFFILLEQMNAPFPGFRKMMTGLFCAVACLPLVFTLLAPRGQVQAYPYHPPTIQRVANWMLEDELIMSDIPWAVAWYGNRQAVWLTLNAQEADSKEDFYQVSDHLKPVRGLFLTPETLDGKFLTDWVHSRGHGWGAFCMGALLSGETPKYFPLKKSAPSVPPDQIFLPDQLFLTDHERWPPKPE